MDTPKKICVFGAGALGGAVAAKLATGLGEQATVSLGKLTGVATPTSQTILALVSQLDRQNRRGG